VTRYEGQASREEEKNQKNKKQKNARVDQMG
jgi:hypothetical protein